MRNSEITPFSSLYWGGGIVSPLGTDTACDAWGEHTKGRSLFLLFGIRWLKQRWPCILTVSSQSSVACSKASQSEPFWLEYLPLLSGDTANRCELFHELASYFIGKSSCCSLRHSQKMAEPLAACILKWLCRGDNVLVLQQTCYVTAQRPVGIWRVISFSWNKASLC